MEAREKDDVAMLASPRESAANLRLCQESKTKSTHHTDTRILSSEARAGRGAESVPTEC